VKRREAGMGRAFVSQVIRLVDALNQPKVEEGVEFHAS
jgi:hypothetical protein